MGFRLSVSDEREMLLENGGGLFKARGFFDDNPFLVYNADIVTDLDLIALYNYHVEKQGLATLAVRKRPGNRFLLINNEGILKGWCNIATGEKILAGDPGTGLIEIGFSSVQIVDPSIFHYMKEGIYTVVDLYLKLAGYHRIYTYRHDSGYWFNVGTPEDLDNVREFLA
jgi:NDP-sugar pyrophosphorylase family protein